MTISVGGEHAFNSERLRGLNSGDLITNTKHGLGAICVGTTVWHPLRALVDQFILVFGLDPEVVEDIQARTEDAEVLERATILATRETVLVRNKQISPTGQEQAASFKQTSTSHSVCQARLLPLSGANVARRVLSTCRSHQQLPIVVLFQGDAGAERSRCYLGQLFTRRSPVGTALDQGGQGLEAYSVLSVNQLNLRQSAGWTAQDDLMAKCLPSSHSKQTPDSSTRLQVEAKYELLGNSATDDSTSASAYLLTKWEGDAMSVNRMLAEPPLKPQSCTMYLNGSLAETEFSDMANSSATDNASHKLPDAPLHVLANLLILSGESTGKAEWSYSGQGEFNLEHSSGTSTADQWKRYVASFIEGATHENPALENRSGRSIKQFGFTSCRRNMDFTEQLWGVVEQAPSFGDLLLAFSRVMASITQGKLLPFVHKDNQTIIGQHIRRAVHLSRALQFGYSNKEQTETKDAHNSPESLLQWAQETQAMFADSSSWHSCSQEMRQNTCNMLFELGAWKLERDFEAWLGEWSQPQVNTGSATSLHGSMFGMLPSSTNVEKLQKLIALRDIAQLVWIAQHLFVPGEELQLLMREALSYQRIELEKSQSRGKDDLLRSMREFPVFPVTIKSSLPWLKLAATGSYTLPAPGSWVVKNVQSTHMEAALFSPVGIGTSKYLEPGVGLKSTIARSVARLAVQIAEQETCSRDTSGGQSLDLLEHLRREIQSSPLPVSDAPAVVQSSQTTNAEGHSGKPSSYTEEIPYVCFVASIQTICARN